MREIPLTQGKVALVDDEDFEKISVHKWQAMKGKQCYYAKRTRFGILMHREIMDAPKGKQVDHIDGNGLNNCKSNLRLCSNSENSRNSKKASTKKFSSQYKGVYFAKLEPRRRNKWVATIMYNRKTISIGRFLDEVDAAKAYDKKAIELFGEFANLNFKEQDK